MWRTRINAFDVEHLEDAGPFGLGRSEIPVQAGSTGDDNQFSLEEAGFEPILELTGGESRGLAEFDGGHTPHRTTPHFAAEGDEISQDASDHAGRAVAW
jgi:hypothetical protein